MPYSRSPSSDFWDNYAPYRTGPLGIRKKLFMNPRPLTQQVFGGLADVQTVDSRCTLVGLDPFPRPFQVFSRKGPFQQPLPCVVGFILRAINLAADSDFSRLHRPQSLFAPRLAGI